MKKLTVITLLCFLTVALVGCGLRAREDVRDTNEQEQVQDEIEVDYDILIQNLTGIWWCSYGVLPVSIYNDGTWKHSFGDIGVSGNVHVSEYNEGFSFELIITYVGGPGAINPPDGYGWRYGDLWGRVIYSPASNELHLERWDGLIMLRERTG